MKLDPQKTAMLTLDFQTGILGMVPGTEAAVSVAAKAVEFARKKHYQLIHVGLGFHEGHPEIPNHSPLAQRLKENNLFVKGSPSAEFHPSIVRAGELVIYKKRISAFAGNELQMLLRARGIETLVFFGISTSGITLSTIRAAFDLDFTCVVLKDACFDPDEETHRVLTEKVFPRQATVLTVNEFVASQENS